MTVVQHWISNIIFLHIHGVLKQIIFENVYINELDKKK